MCVDSVNTGRPSDFTLGRGWSLSCDLIINTHSHRQPWSVPPPPPSTLPDLPSHALDRVYSPCRNIIFTFPGVWESSRVFKTCFNIRHHSGRRLVLVWGYYDNRFCNRKRDESQLEHILEKRVLKPRNSVGSVDGKWE